MARPRSAAKTLTGGGVTTCLRPTGRSGCVKTATTSCPASMSLRNEGTANSGVPMKISLICARSLNQIAQYGYRQKSGRKIELEARLSGLFSRRVLFSLFFVSNFETDLWNQELPFDQSQRLIFQHAGGLGVQLRFTQLFVLPVWKKQQVDWSVIVRRLAGRFRLCHF